LKTTINRSQTARLGAFTLVDVMIAILITSVMFVSLYLGFSQGFGVVQLARENLRATQILQEQLETVRLYTIDQIDDPNIVPRAFPAPFYPLGQTNSGLTYSVTIDVMAPPASESYPDDLRMVVVRANWTSGNVPRRREMRTLVSRYGLHNYVY
jgi:type II secretory pathway pseudopilin PulG